ncbi:MAG: hypothetical protein QMD92_00580 [bacterium]|nr:hypothetical protein [bacterium]
MTLWEKVKKYTEEGVEILKEGALVVAEKTGELAKVGKTKIEIMNLNKKINSSFNEIGGKLYHLKIENKQEEINGDARINELVEEIKKLEEEIKSKEEQLSKVKSEE